MSGGGVIRGPAGNNDCRIYVGNLPPDIRTKDIEDVFYKYGAIRDIDLKNRRGGPPFAFVEFEDPRKLTVPFASTAEAPAVAGSLCYTALKVTCSPSAGKPSDSSLCCPHPTS
ncbi:Serine/arginine-rich splicing factor 1 [Acipenser ruthenus]|uniref:Serine/arginine-rich splicing factor 1 n=1 Tax=Acipenser ruthenus TaxID=7906 RepID=A0A444V1Z4_ACIRT|nr:Serine/arginine-rich splicing factor 1 [Acipenser ruthenus]